MAELFALGRAALGSVSEASALVTQQVETWRTKLAVLTTAEQLNAEMPIIKAIVAPAVQAQAAKLLMDRGEALKLRFDTKAKKFAKVVAA